MDVFCDFVDQKGWHAVRKEEYLDSNPSGRDELLPHVRVRTCDDETIGRNHLPDP